VQEGTRQTLGPLALRSPQRPLWRTPQPRLARHTLEPLAWHWSHWRARAAFSAICDRRLPRRPQERARRAAALEGRHRRSLPQEGDHQEGAHRAAAPQTLEPLTLEPLAAALRSLPTFRSTSFRER